MAIDMLDGWILSGLKNYCSDHIAAVKGFFFPFFNRIRYGNIFSLQKNKRKRCLLNKNIFSKGMWNSGRCMQKCSLFKLF